MSSSIFLLLLFLFLFFSFVFLSLLLFCFVDIKEDDLETFVTFEEEVEDFVFPVPEESLLGGRPLDFFFVFLVVVVPLSFFTFVFFVGPGPELDDENSNGLFQTVFTFRVRLLSAENNWSCDSIGITPFFCLDVAMIDCHSPGPQFAFSHYWIISHVYVMYMPFTVVAIPILYVIKKIR
ncbi:hypothetical protein FRACYDRAFT_236969 [Fragilariopsis cylindrus CCMP1102]|uniref:Uncharacterized protein n=1 Tax=Fragilariopsis cylindrus CCMP1102 TaxID=635003 RepID=A0A1E7FKJ9_9STRA|nr:hypothetical protein FRACYDRAFT_236969 [Fragilariopsis cylindrus CCMP1102]|eukprot:OEU18691.1 hypothetical protein FRACYDRAFT_236969 [Fragilariopsis cylindrus CCMP1102]